MAFRGLLLVGLAWITLVAAKSPASRATSDSTTTTTRKVYSVEDSPGYVPLGDPESTSVRIGRRLNAPRVTQPLRGGAKGLDELGRAVCRSLHHSDLDSRMALCVTDDEFRDILWREFPQSRPVTGLTWEDGWRVLSVRLRSGCISAIHDWGGHHYDFMRFEVDSVMRYRNFKMHSRMTLVARDDEGRLQRMTWLRAAVERGGRFKLYSLKD